MPIHRQPPPGRIESNTSTVVAVQDKSGDDRRREDRSFTVPEGNEMSKENDRTTTTRQRFATLAVATIATAIPVMAMVPAAAMPTPALGTVQAGRAEGSVTEISAPPPVNLWTPNGCSNRNCRHWGQDNRGCNANANHAGTSRYWCPPRPMEAPAAVHRLPTVMWVPLQWHAGSNLGHMRNHPWDLVARW